MVLTDELINPEADFIIPKIPERIEGETEERDPKHSFGAQVGSALRANFYNPANSFAHSYIMDSARKEMSTGNILTPEKANEMYPSELEYTEAIDEGVARYYSQIHQDNRIRNAIAGSAEGFLENTGTFAAGLAGAVVSDPIGVGASALLSLALPPLAGAAASTKLAHAFRVANGLKYVSTPATTIGGAAARGALWNIATDVPVELAKMSKARDVGAVYSTGDYATAITVSALFGGLIGGAGKAWSDWRGKGISPDSAGKISSELTLEQRYGLDGDPEVKINKRVEYIHRTAPHQQEFYHTPKMSPEFSGASMFAMGDAGINGFEITKMRSIDGEWGDAIVLIDNPNKAFNTAMGSFDMTGGVVLSVRVSDGIKLLNLNETLSEDILAKLRQTYNINDSLSKLTGKKLLDTLAKLADAEGYGAQARAKLNTFFKDLGYDGYHFEGSFGESKHNTAVIFDPSKVSILGKHEVTPSVGSAEAIDATNYRKQFDLEYSKELKLRQLRHIPNEELNDIEILERTEMQDMRLEDASKLLDETIEDLKDVLAFSKEELEPIDAIKKSIKQIEEGLKENAKQSPAKVREATKALIVCNRRNM